MLIKCSFKESTLWMEMEIQIKPVGLLSEPWIVSVSSLCKATQVWGDKSVRGTEWRTCPRLELGDVVLPTALLWTQMDVPEWVINTPGLCPDSDMKWIRPPPRPFPTLKTLSFWGAKVQLLLVIRCDWLSEKTVCSSDSVTDFSLLF